MFIVQEFQIYLILFATFFEFFIGAEHMSLGAEKPCPLEVINPYSLNMSLKDNGHVYHNT
jgi:hypothetical protein